MIHVANIIHSLTVGGAARTMIATAKYTKQLGGVRHSLVMLDLKHSDPSAIEFAISQGMEIPPVRNKEELLKFIADVDIVQVNWWQHPEMDDFFRSALPACRLMGWFHCACDYAPMLLTDELAEVCDLVVGGSSHTYSAPAITKLPTDVRLRKTDYVVGGADFERLESLTLKQKKTSPFKIGYIGTVNPVKMYADFVPLHLGLNIPNARVIVCGGNEHLIFENQAKELGLGELFDFRGYVSDIIPVLEEINVYGYPLCKDTYAASELNLQEAMYAGVPVVAFPHGGLKTLIVDNFNGYLVNSEIEYRQALEHLYNNPSELERLSKNAVYFAREMFGAKRHAPKMKGLYEKLMLQPKKTRLWPGYSAPGVPAKPVIGAVRFIESLGDQGDVFKVAYESRNTKTILNAELQIFNSSHLLVNGGLLPYNGYFPDDAFLNLWSGIGKIATGKGEEGAALFVSALKLGLPSDEWRVFWYLSLIGQAFGDQELINTSLKNLSSLVPAIGEQAWRLHSVQSPIKEQVSKLLALV